MLFDGDHGIYDDINNDIVSKHYLIYNLIFEWILSMELYVNDDIRLDYINII